MVVALIAILAACVKDDFSAPWRIHFEQNKQFMPRMKLHGNEFCERRENYLSGNRLD